MAARLLHNSRGEIRRRLPTVSGYRTRTVRVQSVVQSTRCYCMTGDPERFHSSLIVMVLQHHVDAISGLQFASHCRLASTVNKAILLASVRGAGGTMRRADLAYRTIAWDPPPSIQPSVAADWGQRGRGQPSRGKRTARGRASSSPQPVLPSN